MTKVSRGQIHEFGLRIQRGQISEWKIPAVFGIVEADPLSMYLCLLKESWRGNISAEQVQALMEDKDEALGIYRVTVDYDLSFDEMVASGKYGLVFPNITDEHFPIRGEGKVERELILVHLDKVATTDGVLAELDRRGLRPAKVEELLALGVSRSKLQKEFSVVALGSCWVQQNGGHCFAALWPVLASSERWCLAPGCDDNYWGERYCFLAARKDAA